MERCSSPDAAHQHGGHELERTGIDRRLPAQLRNVGEKGRRPSRQHGGEAGRSFSAGPTPLLRDPILRFDPEDSRLTDPKYRELYKAIFFAYISPARAGAQEKCMQMLKVKHFYPSNSMERSP